MGISNKWANFNCVHFKLYFTTNLNYQKITYFCSGNYLLMPYTPGLHILGELHTSEVHLLVDVTAAQSFIDDKIASYGLHKLGAHYHSFGSDSGYTGIVCLTESHISLHTWPEHGYLTLDVYLSNYLQVNDGKAQGFFEDCVQYFQCKHVSRTELRR